MMRKGSWSQQEDVLLKDCVQANGEGNWHLVPAKAGLNRCRKSCRLRWLNYLKPSLKRGKFEEDEVDLLIKLHNLLGNRWSMIAKRLPGRTGNDVKNYWNTHLANKFTTKNKPASNVVPPVQVIKPKPRTLKKMFLWQHPTPSSSLLINSSSYPNPPPDDHETWWETLLADNNDVNHPIADISQENSSFDDSLWTMLLSDEDPINQSIWDKLGIDDHTQL